MNVKRQGRTPQRDYCSKPAAENQTEKVNNAIQLLEKILQMTEKQFKTFCSRMQNEFKNDTDYTTVLQILCSLEAIRNMKGAYTNE